MHYFCFQRFLLKNFQPLTSILPCTKGKRMNNDDGFINKEKLSNGNSKKGFSFILGEIFIFHSTFWPRLKNIHVWKKTTAYTGCTLPFIICSSRCIKKKYIMRYVLYIMFVKMIQRPTTDEKLRTITCRKTWQFNSEINTIPHSFKHRYYSHDSHFYLQIDSKRIS